MRSDRLKILRSYTVEQIQTYLESRQSDSIPEYMQEYILQLNSVVSIIHHNGTNITRACKSLQLEYPSLTFAQARGIYYDALEFFYMDESVSARAWDMVFADQFEDLKNLAIKEDKLSVAYRCMEKAHELRTMNRESLDYDWTPPVFLISTTVKPESLGFKSQRLMDIARRAEDVEFRHMIDSLETTEAEKERLYKDAGIKDIEFDKIREDSDNESC